MAKENEPEKQKNNKAAGFKMAFLRRVADLSTAALGLVAALAWNEAITSLVKTYIPEASATISLFLYAIFITLVAVILTIPISNAVQRLENKDGQKE